MSKINFCLLLLELSHPIKEKRTATNSILARLRLVFVFEIIVFNLKISYYLLDLGIELFATSPSRETLADIVKNLHKKIIKIKDFNMKLKLVFAFLGILFLNINCKNEKTIKVIKKNHSEKIKTENVFNETALDIAENLKPKNSKIIHKVINADIWGRKNSIIAFYETTYIDSTSTTEKYERQYVEGYIYVLQNKNWRKILISKFEDDNVFTEIQSVFFANADNDKEKELIILTTCKHNLQYLYDGTEYSTWVFDNFTNDKIPNELKYLTNISEKLEGGFEGYLEDNENSTAKFVNATEVKIELKRLGY